MDNTYGDYKDILGALSNLKDKINDLNARLIKDHSCLAAGHLTAAYSHLASASIEVRAVAKRMSPTKE